LADTSAKLFFTADGPAGVELLSPSPGVSSQPIRATNAAAAIVVSIVFFVFIKFIC